jgi:pantoate--beta-alanine ligase
MRTVRTTDELRATLAPARREGLTIGLVPTMGALHEGHLSLITSAREQCDLVVVSLFVNPAQFNERSDLERYPRDEHRDAELASQSGADVLFAPSAEEVYPAGFSTSVEVLGVTERLEGAARASEHFRGVATVVTKLLGMAQPGVAYFGQKDAQQLLVIRRLVADLNLPVRIEACPTVREPDGLAMSSRNRYLEPRQRDVALALSRALHAAAAAAPDSASAAVARAERVLAEQPELTLDYVAAVDDDTWQEPSAQTRSMRILVAGRIGSTRLIDNVSVDLGTRDAG